MIFKVKDQCHRVKFLPHSILVNTLESTSFNGFWPNLVQCTYIVLRRVWNPIDFQGQGVKFLLHIILVNTLESTSFNGFWPIRRVWNPIYVQGHRVKFIPHSILVNTLRINILLWILTKLGTYLDLKRIWNRIDFQGQRSRSQGLIFRQGDMPRFALPLLLLLCWLFYVDKIYWELLQ